MRIVLTPALTGVAILAAFASNVSGQPPPPPELPSVEFPTLSITHAGLTAHGAAGSACAEAPDGLGWCVDSEYPRPVGRLPVRPLGRVILKSSVEASELEARLMRVRASRFGPVGQRLPSRRISPHRWRVTLPKRLPSANVLDVSIRWNNPRDGRGDASFAGGIRRDCG